MPNFVINKITIFNNTEKLKKIFFLKNNRLNFSFESFLPTPKDLEESVSSYLSEYILRYLSDPSEENKENILSKLESYKHINTKSLSFEEIISEFNLNEERYSATTPYSWRINKWGCRGDASDSYCIEGDPTVFYFKTPWNVPLDGLLHLSALLFNSKIIVDFADENIGYNCGRLILLNRQIEERPTEEDLKKKYTKDFAKNLWSEYHKLIK